ncbi:MAG: hypothetical protein ACK5QS_07725 [Pseudanabaenaceae cyanobacterium]|jgi:hypothetical protein
MSRSLISKIVALSAVYLIFEVTMYLTKQPVSGGSAIAQALKLLSFGIHEKYGIFTLICIAFGVDSCLKRIL